MEVCIRRAKPGDEETLAMIQIKSWQSAFADILDRETLEGCTDFERVTATYRRLLEQGIGNGYLLTVDVQPEHQMEKVLYATDELTGLIGAVVRMLPTKSVQDLQLKSLKKKFKDKKFAAGCSREVIERGADMLGWSLDELMERTITAMQASPAANGN